MRRHFPFLLYLAALSALSGWLMSKMSWIARQGVNFLYREYKFLKVWYQGAAFVFGVLLLLYALQSWAARRMSRSGARTVQVVALALAALGMYATYQDFRTFSHSLLKERFHLGAYLFWIGWMSISLFLLAQRRPAAQRRR